MKQIKDTLKELGIMPNLKGYHYLADAIELCIEEVKTRKSVSSWMWIYRKVARIHNTTPSRVERCIRNAVDKATQTELYKKIIYESANSAFIALVAEYVMEEM
jgi:two-component system response regulator (stage 0 sporulation protein A)